MPEEVIATTPEVVAAPVNALAPETTTPVTAAPSPQRLADPFANLSAPPKKTEPKSEPAKGVEKAIPATTAPKAEGDKKVAVRRDPIAEQRTRIEQQNKTISETTRERDELKRQFEELRTRGGGDTSALTATVEELRKKNEQLAGEIASRDYSKSTEYQTKYEKPFNDAANQGREIIESLTVTETDADGNETKRAAVWSQDFAMIYALPRPAARARAKAMFGEDANDVMAQYDKLKGLDNNKRQALTEWQTGATQREQSQRAEQLMRSQNIEKAFDLVTKNLSENDPEFQIKPDDKETKSLWDKSQAIVDRAYFERSKLAPHELILLDAAVRLRAINEPVLRARNAQLKAENEELRSRLEEKETSTNGSTRRRADATPGKSETPWEAELTEKLKAAG